MQSRDAKVDHSTDYEVIVQHTHTELLFWDDYFFFSILSADPPKITQHPKHQSISPGAYVAFTVEATGDDLPFQGQKDGKDIDGDVSQLQYSQADGSSTLHTQKSDKCHYGCFVKNPVKNSGKTSHTAEHTDCKFSLACIATMLNIEVLIYCLVNLELVFVCRYAWQL